MVLHVSFPAMRDHPTSDKIVVVRVELILSPPPFLVGEGVGEALVLEDLGPIGHRASGHAWQAAIQIGCSPAVKVASLEIESTQIAPDAL